MARRPEIDEFHFDGFEGPNTTPVPDVVFDRLLARLGEAELKALMYIIRRTFGFKKDSDSISFNQFIRGITTKEGRSLDEGCGIRDRTTLSKALKSLEAKGIVLSEKGIDERGENTTTVYRLRFRDESQTAREAIPQRVVGDPYYPGMNSRPPVVGNAHPQETVVQQTDIQNSKIRNTSREQATKDRAIMASARYESSVRRMNQTELEIGPAESAASGTGGMTTLAEELTRRQSERPVTEHPAESPSDHVQRDTEAGPQRRPRVVRPRHVPHQDEAYQIIQAYIADFSRELNDRAPLKTSTTRAYHLYQRAGIDQSAFIAQLYAARAIVKERTATIHTRGEDSAAGFPMKHKAAYFFAVLEDLLGLREAITEASPAAPVAAESAPLRRRRPPTSSQADDPIRRN